MNFGIALRMLRKRLGLTQHEFAERCNLSQNTLSHIETRSKRPSEATITTVCEVFEIPEFVIYMLALEECDVSPKKRNCYNLVYPAICGLSLQIVAMAEVEK